MKQKILEALKQGYKNLGMSEEAFERVAAFGETFIKEESEIANFVKGAETILKAEQSAADKVRTKAAEDKKSYEAKIAELEAKLKEASGQQQQQQQEQQTTQQPDIEALINSAIEKGLATAVKPLSDKIAAYEAEKLSKSVVETAFANADKWENAGNFEKQLAEAKRIAMKSYKRSGNNMTAKELEDEIKEEFDIQIKNKGNDGFVPFGSDGVGGKPDFGGMAQRLAERGKIVTETKD